MPDTARRRVEVFIKWLIADILREKTRNLCSDRASKKVCSPEGIGDVTTGIDIVRVQKVDRIRVPHVDVNLRCIETDASIADVCDLKRRVFEGSKLECEIPAL